MSRGRGVGLAQPAIGHRRGKRGDDWIAAESYAKGCPGEKPSPADMAKPAPAFDPYLLFARTGASKTTERVSKMADYVDSETGARGLKTTAPTRDGGSNLAKPLSIYAIVARPRRLRRQRTISQDDADRRQPPNIQSQRGRL